MILPRSPVAPNVVVRENVRRIRLLPHRAQPERLGFHRGSGIVVETIRAREVEVVAARPAPAEQVVVCGRIATSTNCSAETDHQLAPAGEHCTYLAAGGIAREGDERRPAGSGVGHRVRTGAIVRRQQHVGALTRRRYFAPGAGSRPARQASPRASSRPIRASVMPGCSSATSTTRPREVAFEQRARHAVEIGVKLAEVLDAQVHRRLEAFTQTPAAARPGRAGGVARQAAPSSTSAWSGQASRSV